MFATALLIAMAAYTSEKPLTVSFSRLEKATITITPTKNISFEGVKTPDGHRIRVKTDGIVIEATKLQFISKNYLVTMEIDKDGKMTQSGEELPTPVKP